MQPPPPPLPHAVFGDRVLHEKAMHPTNVRRAALALQAHAHTMPQQRVEHLTVSLVQLAVHSVSGQPLPRAGGACCCKTMRT